MMSLQQSNMQSAEDKLKQLQAKIAARLNSVSNISTLRYVSVHKCQDL